MASGPSVSLSVKISFSDLVRITGLLLLFCSQWREGPQIMSKSILGFPFLKTIRAGSYQKMRKLGNRYAAMLHLMGEALQSCSRVCVALPQHGRFWDPCVVLWSLS